MERRTAQAYEAVDWDKSLEIYGYDIDSDAVRAAEENAAEAGVADDIVFERHDGAAIDSGGQEGGIIITNPPYGERIGDQALHRKTVCRMGRIPG